MEDNLIRENYRFAGLWPRFWALFLDFAFICVIFFPITRVVKGTWIMSAGDHRWVSGWFVTDPICLIFLGIIFLYFILPEAYAGATLGKWLIGIRVISIVGGKPGLIKSVVRNLLRIVDGLPFLNIIGIILIVRSRERARFGDRMANTRVIKVS